VRFQSRFTLGKDEQDEITALKKRLILLIRQADVPISVQSPEIDIDEKPQG
jgi:hypothetical protein